VLARSQAVSPQFSTAELASVQHGAPHRQSRACLRGMLHLAGTACLPPVPTTTFPKEGGKLVWPPGKPGRLLTAVPQPSRADLLPALAGTGLAALFFL